MTIIAALLFSITLPEWASWILAFGAMSVGILLLTKSADLFVDGAVALAHRMKMPPLIIGFTIVGFGTSAPEMLVSALSSAQGIPALALGNAYGSNITNILLILGASMLIAPIALHRVALKRDLPFLATMIVLTWICSRTGDFSRANGALLLGCFVVYMVYQIVAARRQGNDAADAQKMPNMPLGKALLLTFGGLGVLLGSSQLLVGAAKWIAVRSAELVGISQEATQLIVGVTVVALGTSLPELMASVSAMRKGQDDIALGNVVGSNCFNLCVVATIAMLIRPVENNMMPEALCGRDLYVMFATTLILWIPGLLVWLHAHRKNQGAAHPDIRLGRIFGVFYITLWVVYTVWVVIGTH